GFQHRTIRVAASADVVNRGDPRQTEEFPKGGNQIMAMNVVPDLFAAVPENPVRFSSHCALHQVSKKTVQLGAGMRRSGQTAAAKANGFHSEILSIFLNEEIRGSFSRDNE